MIFKEWRFECGTCSERVTRFQWSNEPFPECSKGHGPLYESSFTLSRNRGVIDDQIEGGPRLFENFGHEPVWIESKSQWRREMDKRQLVNVVRHESDYYAKRRKWHDEEKRDTGRNVEY